MDGIFGWRITQEQNYQIYTRSTSLLSLLFSQNSRVNVENRVNFISVTLIFVLQWLCSKLFSLYGSFFTIQLQGLNVYSFNIPYCKSHSKVDFEYNSIVLWNFLPNSLKNVNDRNILKLKCKKYLLEKNVSPTKL